MAKEILEMPVELATMELPDTKTLRLKWPDGYNPDFKTGQFITLWWPDTPTYKRAYSLSSCALDRGYLRSHRQARRQDGHAHRGLGEARRQIFRRSARREIPAGV